MDTASQRKPAAAETKPTAGHTPGPWCFYADLPSTEPNWHVVTNASRMRVLANVHIEPGNLVDEANAHLISAAPCMYEALKKALPFIDDALDAVTVMSDSVLTKECREVVRLAHAALQKATPPEIQS